MKGRELELSNFNMKLLNAAVGFGLTINIDLKGLENSVEFVEPNPENMDVKSDKPGVGNAARQIHTWKTAPTMINLNPLEAQIDALSLKVMKHMDESMTSASWCFVDPRHVRSRFISRFNETLLQKCLEYRCAVRLTMRPGDGPFGESNAEAQVDIDFKFSTIFSDKMSETGRNVDECIDKMARKVLVRLNVIYVDNLEKKEKAKYS